MLTSVMINDCNKIEYNTRHIVLLYQDNSCRNQYNQTNILHIDFMTIHYTYFCSHEMKMPGIMYCV